jgi:hypothetical protein
MPLTGEAPRAAAAPPVAGPPVPGAPPSLADETGEGMADPLDGPAPLLSDEGVR